MFSSSPSLWPICSGHTRLLPTFTDQTLRVTQTTNTRKTSASSRSFHVVLNDVFRWMKCRFQPRTGSSLVVCVCTTSWNMPRNHPDASGFRAGKAALEFRDERGRHRAAHSMGNRLRIHGGCRLPRSHWIREPMGWAARLRWSSALRITKSRLFEVLLGQHKSMATTNAVSIGPDDMARVVDPVGEGLHSTGNDPSSWPPQRLRAER